MSHDDQTLGFYDQAAKDYADRFTYAKPSPSILSFFKLLPKGGKVLDFGCGPGRSAANFRDEGFDVDAFDGSEGMLEIARTRYGIEGRLATFDQLDAVDLYDGIWCNFSLLHAPRTEMPDHLRRLHTALKAGGVLHLALKLGEDQDRDRLGRFYTYYSEEELTDLLTAANFEIFETSYGNEAGMAGEIEPWIMIRAKALKV